MSPHRKTLAEPASVSGLGLFTEHSARCTILPAEPGEGITLRRTDLPNGSAFEATIAHLNATPVHPAFAQIPPRHTSLSGSGERAPVVHTTEHLLAALVGLGVTDARIELDGPEVPIDDGSAARFAAAIRDAGLVPLGVTPERLVVRETITVTSDDARATITAEPLGEEESPSFRYRLDYGPSAPIPAQEASWTLGDDDGFTRDIAPARTFSLQSEAAQMRALGLFRSFSPRDLLVIRDDDGGPIDNEWRFENEAARHKLLDLIGDLALVGRPIHARVIATRAGHALNHAMARALVARSSSGAR